MKKRPIWLQETVDRINMWLRESPNEYDVPGLKVSAERMRGKREGWAEALVSLLCAHNSYQGFTFLASAGMKKDDAGIATFEDESRRQYI